MKTVAIVGTFDSKGLEYLYIKKKLEKCGVKTLTIHAGVFVPVFTPDVSNGDVARIGGVEIEELVEKKDRGYAMEILSKGLMTLIPSLYEAGAFDGIMSLGGSGGTSLVTPAMRKLPLGVPKIMVSTMASGDTRRYIGTSDIMMIPSIVDVAGVNTISSTVFTNAVHAMIGLLEYENHDKKTKKPLIAATMYGVTTPCVTKAKEYLEEQGYEVLVFHASGTGGQSMESLINRGMVSGVLDITTTEWADELFGGIMAAGPDRLNAAAQKGIPQVVSVGALDMVTFGEWDSVPEKYKDRILYKHNPLVTVMRTNQEENILLGEKIAEKLNKAKGPTTVMLPLKGVSMVDQKGGPFYGPEEDQVLFNTLKKNILNPNVNIMEVDAHINDEEFALKAAKRLIELM